jgi:hypothetical protein
VDDAQAVMEGAAGGEQVRDRRAMPHPVVVSEIALKI